MSKSKQFKYKNSVGQDILVDLAVDAANVETTSFTQAAVRENLNPGEGLLTLFGKLMKWFSDMKEVAWSGRYLDLTDRPVLGNAASANIANNLTTEEEGFVLDARQGKELNGSLGGNVLIAEGSGVDTKYYIQSGADTASKKELGSGKIFKTTISTSYLWMGSYSVDLSVYIDWYKEVNHVLAALIGQNASDSNLKSFNYGYDASSGQLNMTFSAVRQPTFEIMVASMNQ